MDTGEIEELLHEEEGPSLDFKREQYRFIGASDHEKSELLKDILSFANAWRRSTAYILVGVEEVKGGRSKPVGVSQHFDDSDLQQFVQGKVNGPLNFSYEAMEVDSKPVGVYEIPVQAEERPFYMTQDYGHLDEEDIPIRRGSSTEYASPDEVKKMGQSIEASHTQPALKVGMGFEEDEKILESPIRFESDILSIDGGIKEIPNYSSDSFYNAPMDNTDYYRDLARFVQRCHSEVKINAYIENLGSETLNEPHVKLIFPKKDGLILSVEPIEKPSRSIAGGITPIQRQLQEKDEALKKPINEHTIIRLPFDNVYSKDRSWSPAFYIGSTEDTKIDCEARVFADNINEPIQETLGFEITSNRREFSSSTFMRDVLGIKG